MKSLTILFPIVAAVLLVTTGCQSNKMIAPTFVESHGPSTTYPSGNNAGQAFDYALDQWDKGEVEEAARFFERASIVRTDTGLWEFESLLNATVCWLEAGDAQKARATLKQAQTLTVQAPPSPRERYLNALLLDGDARLLSPALRASLPNQR